MQPVQSGDPEVVGPYRVLGRLGSGGMGRVFLGRSPGGATVAVKLVHPHFAHDDEFRTRFRREVEAARRVGGAWTAPVLDAGPDDDVPWVATGYVAGPSLSDAVAEHGPLPEETLRPMGAGLAEALAAVHGLGLVHRDVKPSNVLLTLDGPRLIDFGIARATDGTASLTASGASVGSPGYMSPEQILGRPVTGEGDVFSLGAVLVFAATGQSPFPGDSAPTLLYLVVHEEPQLHGLTGELADLALACLAKDPAARPAPAEVVGRLTAGGEAAHLVRPGWLPPPVTEQISRRAVELLAMEAQPAAAPERRNDGLPSGPVPLQQAEYGPGAFGPPPVLDGTAPGAGAAGAAGPPTPPGATPPGGPGAGTAGAGTAGATPGGPAAGGAAAFGAAAATAPERRAEVGLRSRRFSCTLVLSVAGALAALMLGLFFVPGLLDGDEKGSQAGDTPTGAAADGGGTGGGTGGGSETTGGGTGGDTGEESESPSQEPTGAAVDGVPEKFAGGWKGEVIQEDGVPNGDVSVEIKQGGKGEYVAYFDYSLYDVAHCYSRAKLTAATDTTLTLHEEDDPARENSEGVCAPGESTVTLTHKGGTTVEYRSDAEASGNPRATLTKGSG
ncbi:serine/threonine-protein kinase [Streptomyces sp. WMMC500]|uniref:serine/threonine-protein kinase n=1 Tax=Streptomyces sp. WMMC500 TaxID=3015154 RepID=UPI00248D2A40|nr:serine/threonine-protein kinase [Streptomyces sp. WMMC500]WBB63880.1 serine/threonine-protein kinase [Streptomyces sp. WMMC500]